MATVNISNLPGNLSPSDFLSYIRGSNGPSKSSRFLVTIAKPPGLNNGTFGAFENELAYLTEAAEFPGRGFMSVDIQYHGPAFKIPYLTQYEDLNLTFICRDAFLERQYFDNWMELINPIGQYDFAYRNSYATKIRIFQVSDVADGNGGVKAQYQFTFDSIYPILINPQPVTWADDNFNRLTVAFTYKRWYRENMDNINTPTYDLPTKVGPSAPNYVPPVANPINPQYGRYGNNVINEYDEQRLQAEGN